jgi:hypothetical protein
MLSPILTLLLHYTSNLNHETWEIRQASSCGLSSLIDVIDKLKVGKVQYALLRGDGSHHVTKAIEVSELLNNVIPLIIVQMLKDQFSDYEDLNVLTPVRSQGSKVITSLCKYSVNENKLKSNI